MEKNLRKSTTYEILPPQKKSGRRTQMGRVQSHLRSNDGSDYGVVAGVGLEGIEKGGSQDRGRSLRQAFFLRQARL
ncbi:unnamed protein product [Camellia sinensis]